MTYSIILEKPGDGDFPRLLEIWEASVRATHDFLAEDDIQFFKSVILEKEVFRHTTLKCARVSDGIIVGFIGVSEDSLDMIFIDPRYRSAGIGKSLVMDAIRESGIRKVEVNEQNEQAIGFYERFGFVTVSRSESDESGKPFPLLHMQIK